MTITREKMFELAASAAERIMIRHGEMAHLMLMYATEGGEFNTVLVEPAWMANDQSKDALVASMTLQMMVAKAQIYAYASEIWIASLNLPPYQDEVMEIQDALDEGHAWYEEQRRKHGWNPAVGGGRDDGVLIIVGDKEGSEQVVYRIDRYPGKGRGGVRRVRGLVRRQDERDGAWGEGRFRDLLVDFRARKRHAH